MVFFLERLGVNGPIERAGRVILRVTAFTVGITFLLPQITCLQAQPRSPTSRQPGSTPVSAPGATRDACRFLTPGPATVETAVLLSLAEATNLREIKAEMASEGTQESKQKDDDEFGLTLPTRDHLFRLQSEQAFLERLRKELPKVKNVEFPKDVPYVPGVEKLIPFGPQTIAPVFSQVCYRPLYFEDKRTERFGEYVPYVQPLVSTTRFYVGVILLPYRMYLQPPWVFECDNR
jgi:hypothetical protein